MTSADPALMRAINQFQVMDAIRRHGPISRVEIVNRTELSPTTVSAITSSLLGENVIMPAKPDAKADAVDGADNPIVPRDYGVSGSASRGRPRKMLALNPSAACVVGVKLTPNQITVAVTDFRADVLNTLSAPLHVHDQPTDVIADLVESNLRTCVADAGLDMGDIRGVSIGLPGVVERTAGVCRQSTIFHQRDVPFTEAMEARLGVKVSLDTDANLITLAESWFGQAKGMDDFMVVSVEQNLGLGIMHQGELFRGANGRCPDLSDLLIPSENGVGGRRLSEVASVSAMLEAVGIWTNGEHGSQRLEIETAIAQLVSRAEAGDEPARKALARAGRGLGAAIASLITLFSPSRVIITGAGVAAGEHLLGPLRETVGQNTPASMREVTQIAMHSWTNDTWARGAAAMTLRDLYGMPWEAMAPVMRI